MRQRELFLAQDNEQKLEELKKRVHELEMELSEREDDVRRFRNELIHANEEIERLIGRVSDELKLAGRIQHVLAPTEYPNIQGVEFSTKFIPGTRSGGDYFDIFEHQDRFRFGILMASSSGYTMSALFLSVLLKFTGRMEARKGGDAASIMKLIAQDLCPDIPEGNRASLFYGVVDRRSFSLSYCSVGHISALVQRSSDRKLSPLASSGDYLQRDFSMDDLKEDTIYLNPKDRLILCSEGVAGTLNPRGEKFGMERLYKTVLAAPSQGVHGLRNEILYQTESFRGEKKSPSDLTVVVSEIKERVLKLAKAPVD